MDTTPPIPSAHPETGVAAPADADVVALVRRGDADAAFALLAGRYEAKVYRLCFALLRNPDAAQDAAQESLIRVWRALPRYDGRASLSTWIYAITRNRCLTARSQAPADVSLSDEAVLAEAEAIPQAAADTDTADVVRRLVADLPEPARQVVTLYYFEDRNLSEVAHMLGLPPGTVKTRLFRARAALHGQLRERGLAGPENWSN